MTVPIGSSSLERPFWGEADFSGSYDSFVGGTSPPGDWVLRLATGGIADLNILALLNGDPDRVADVYSPATGYPGAVAGRPDSSTPQPPSIFFNWLDLLQFIYSKDPGTLTNDDALDIDRFISHITYYVENGLRYFEDPNDPASEVKQVYFTPEVARQLDVLVKSFKSVGFVPGDGDSLGNLDALARWHNLRENGRTLETLVSMVGFIGREGQINVEDVGYAAQSLQRMLEIDYVNRGTQLVFDDLSGLKDRQTIAKDALGVLTRVQDLHNQLMPVQIADDLTEVFVQIPSETDPVNLFDFLNNSTISDDQQWLEKWEEILEAYFAPVQVEPKPGSPDFSSETGPWLDEFEALKAEIQRIVLELQEQRFDDTKTALAEEIARRAAEGLPPLVYIDTNAEVVVYDEDNPSNINFLSVDDIARLEPALAEQFGAQPGGLEQTLVDVRANMLMPPSLPGIPDPDPNDPLAVLRSWIIDGWPNIDNSADGVSDFRSEIQDNIRTAITAGSNLNDELKEELRKTLFLFEEFYKSASAVLAKITQIIEKLAGNIRR